MKKPMATRIERQSDLAMIQGLRRDKTKTGLQLLADQRNPVRLRTRMSRFIQLVHFKLTKEVVTP